jgi:hypothetical protein
MYGSAKMENKLKHLEIIQNIINRMASNSFLVKGWCITLVSAVFVLSGKDANTMFIAIAFFPVLMFWILDAYFLRQERLFRKLYDKVRTTNEDAIDFSMNTTPFTAEVASWLQVAFSQTLILFYGAIVVAILLAVLIVSRVI